MYKKSLQNLVVSNGNDYYFSGFCGLIGWFFCWLCLGSLTQLHSAGGLAGLTDMRQPHSHICGWCWLGYLGSFSRSAFQENKGGATRSLKGEAWNSLHFTSAAFYWSQTSHYRKCNWLRASSLCFEIHCWVCAEATGWVLSQTCSWEIWDSVFGQLWLKDSSMTLLNLFLRHFYPTFSRSFFLSRSDLP